MDYKSRWHFVSELGRGGQGKVYRVLDALKLDIEGDLYPKIEKTIRGFSGVQYEGTIKKHCKSFCDAVIKIMRMEEPTNYGALKELHEPQDARDYERAEERIKIEIKAMSEVSHPNLLKILDYDQDGKWFVSEFHPKGTLDKNKSLHEIKNVKSFLKMDKDALKRLRALGYIR